MKNGTNNGSASQKESLKTVNLVVDDVPYVVGIREFTFNEEPRYLVTINGGEEHTFVQDPSVGRLRAIDDMSSSIPDALEQEISRQLSAI